MKMEQSTTQASTAFLRNANNVDAPKTNSLCCAAAGIIDPLSATAEAPIPHEKLREAAAPDATLIAQNRPPAQLVVGYKYSTETSHQPQTRQLSGRLVNSLRIHRERCRAPQSINRACIGKKARHDHALLQGAPDNQKGLHHIGQRQVDRIDAAHCEQLLLNCGHYFNSGSLIIGLNCVEVLKQKTTHRSGTRCNAANQSKHHFIFSLACLSSVTRLFISYNQCSYNRSQATDYLEPSRGITLPKNQNQPSYYEQYTQRGKQPPNQSFTGEYSAVSNHYWLLAPKRKQRMPISAQTVHGGSVPPRSMMALLRANTGPETKLIEVAA